MTITRSRLLAIGILLGVLGVAWLAIAQPVLDAFATQDETIRKSRGTLAVYRRKIAMEPVLQARLAEVTRREAGLNDAIAGTSAELAAANIQNLMKSMADADFVQIVSVQNLPPVQADGFERLDVQYDMSVPMTRLKSFLYRIEASVPFLFLDGVDIRAPDNWQAAGMHADVPSLQVHWTVRGYRRAVSR